MDSTRHPDLDRLAQADRPAFLFSADGLVWCNAAAAAFWGAPSRAGMLTNDARLAAASAQAVDILRNLPVATTRLERMKIVPFGRTVPLTAQVQRLTLPEGGRALLVTGMEAVARHAVAAVLAREAPPAPVSEPVAEPAAEPVVAAAEDTVPTETPAAESPPVAAAEPAPERAPAPIASVKPVRFAWQTDAAGVLARVSDAFIAAVGADSLPHAAETLAQFGARAGWDADIVEALRAADTLTTRAVRWPLAGADEAVSVELSATPVPGGGLRGLGIVTGRAAPLPVVAPCEAEAASDSQEPTADEPAPSEPEPEPEPAPEPDLDAAAEAEAPEPEPETDTAPAEAPPVTGEPVASAANVLAFPSQKLAPPAPERRLDATDQAALRTIARVLGGPIAVPQPSHAEDSNASFAEAPHHHANDAAGTGGGAGPDARGPPGEPAEDAPPAEPAATPARPALVEPPPFAGIVMPSAFFVREPADAPPPPPADDGLAAELATAERRVRELTAILDTATDGVVVLDDRYRIVSLNRAAQALFGVENEAMAGLPFTHVLAPESQREVTGYIDGLMQNGVVTLLNDGRDVVGVEKNGGRIPLFMTVGRLGDHEPGRFCAVLRDVTQWKRAEQDLIEARRAAEQANNQKSDFLAKISHEIRTPLNAIIGFSEVMIEERFGRIESERYRGYLADIRSSGEHLLSLVNDLLDLSKIEAGKLELSFSAVRLGDLVQQAVATMQPQANREGVILRTSLPRTPPIVADPRSLRQILFNLLSNAIKFTKSGGQVIVSTAMSDTGEVSLRVRDTGVGMSDKDVRTALEPFRQIATKGRAQTQGTGLGLPLTKALAEANRAAFFIESAPAEGTLVQITFPSTRVLAE